MKTLKTTTYFTLLLLVIFSFSCSPEDGKDGQDGAQGEQGIAGQDGNANVSIYTINFPTQNTNSFGLSFPELSQDVLDNDVIITYFSYGNGTYYPIPGIANNLLIEVELIPNFINVYFYNRTDGNSRTINATPNLFVKAVIIESNNTDANRSAQATDFFTELQNAGIDVNDYYAVCDYYGIAY